MYCVIDIRVPRHPASVLKAIYSFKPTLPPPPLLTEELKRQRDAAARKAAKEEHRKAKAAALAAGTLLTTKKKAPAPSGPIAFMFPGQGSQAVGMLNQSKDIPAVKEMLAKAEEVLGYDLLALCTEGPKEKLDDTVYSQVCWLRGEG